MKMVEERHKERLAGLEARLQQTQDELEASYVANADLVKKADDLSRAREEADRTAFVRWFPCLAFLARCRGQSSPLALYVGTETLRFFRRHF